ncbi:MAG: glycosyltransferase family 2 protein [Xanthobacteraceae bacterium]
MNAPTVIEAPPPRIAVIVPAYGVAHLVGEALASVQAQTLADWECWVVDDGAPDDVAGAVAPFLADSRIRLLQIENGGVGRARNLATAKTRAPYIALLDGDDLLRPRYLERMVAALDADPAARIVTCDARMFGAISGEGYCASAMQRGHGTTLGTLAEVLDRSFKIYIGSTFRRADWERVGGFDEAMTHCEDFDLWLRLLLGGGHALYLDEVLGEYRVRPSSASASGEKMIRGVLHAYRKVLPHLTGRPEAAIALAMIVRNEGELEFEWAVDRVLAGDVRGALSALHHARDHAGGVVWPVALTLWDLFPSLAAPMLRWRRHAHSRHAVDRQVARLDQPMTEAEG